MSSAGHFNTPAQILPKHLIWQEHVVVPEDFSKDEILELKKWSRITGDEDSEVDVATRRPPHPNRALIEP